MKWGIIAALDAELALILEAMEIKREEVVYGVQFFDGLIDGKEVTTVTCSIGTINAAACATVLIREFKVSAILNTGAAGSTTSEMNLLDVVLSSEVLFHDADVRFMRDYHPYQESFLADRSLIALAEKCISEMEDRGFNYRVGRIATGDVFVDDLAVKRDIIARVNPLCVEMEGAAIGQIAYMSDTPFLIIRSLSDDSGEDAQGSFENLLERAAKHSAAIVLKMIAAKLE
ncbi:MAG: 5'-methylthioadenosine/adenosylhomocysteine nucleosidase [Oscillospiraceae bacterium]|nr:5'-methylthioadenosine/adenosylhomocysteine nucleosidase [Oscillospiraceae bacterium]